MNVRHDKITLLPSQNFSLCKDSEAFIEPKVFKVFIRNQISSPTVCNFVCYYA